MRKIKDFFYDKNDIIIVLIILAAAAFIIYTRIGVIMDYPEQLAREAAAAESQQQEETSNTDSNIVSITIDDAATITTVSETLESEQSDCRRRGSDAENGDLPDPGRFNTGRHPGHNNRITFIII